MTRRRLIASPKRHTWRSLANNSSPLDIQSLRSSIRRSDTALKRGQYPYATQPRPRLKGHKNHTLAMIYLGRTSIRCKTLTNASATTEPIFNDESSSPPVISFRLVITSVSCPACRCSSVSLTTRRTVCAAVCGDAISSSTWISIMASFAVAPRRSVRTFSCAVVLGTYEPATISPPVCRGEGR